MKIWTFKLNAIEILSDFFQELSSTSTFQFLKDICSIGLRVLALILLNKSSWVEIESKNGKIILKSWKFSFAHLPMFSRSITPQKLTISIRFSPCCFGISIFCTQIYIYCALNSLMIFPISNKISLLFSIMIF